ncbi:MAG: metal-dependent hydrolase [Flavobacterium sp.]|nr:metal-dependent hydrolase [Flavobacterium sp.]
MDSITQAVLGAAIGESILGKKIGSKAALYGAILGSIPDFDVAFRLFFSPYEMLSIHRGYSHSILFSFLGALFLSVVLKKLSPFKIIPSSTIFLFSWLCLITHILLDAFTAYGTQLFLPFNDTRFGFDSINVIDPFYTFPLLIGLFFSLKFFPNKSNRSSFTNYGLWISTFYLLLTLVHKEFVKEKFNHSFLEQKIAVKELLTMPVGVANLNWYGVAKSKDSLYMQRYSLLGGLKSEIQSFPINEKYLQEVDPEMANTMRWFAKGFYTVDKVNNQVRIYNLQVDMRGIISDGTKLVPTAGYFTLQTKQSKTEFGSGTIKNK